MKRLGLIAGNGRFPLIAARSAREQGIDVIAVAVRQETSRQLESLVKKIYWIDLGELGKLFEIFKKEDIASENLKSLIKSNNVIIVKAKNLRMREALCRKLGRGESEAIVAAIENLADLVVLDDHVARLEAARMGLNVKGTLGIIRRLMDLDIIQYELDELYQDLSEMKFRVKRSIFDGIFKV